MQHELKCWPEYFQAVINRQKLFEIRKNDRNYQEGDTVRLREWDPNINRYTDRHSLYVITYIMRDFDGLKPGYVVLGIRSVFD